MIGAKLARFLAAAGLAVAANQATAEVPLKLTSFSQDTVQVGKLKSKLSRRALRVSKGEYPLGTQKVQKPNEVIVFDTLKGPKEAIVELKLNTLLIERACKVNDPKDAIGQLKLHTSDSLSRIAWLDDLGAFDHPTRKLVFEAPLTRRDPISPYAHNCGCDGGVCNGTC